MVIILVMSVSCLVSPFVQQSTVIAATKQEQENGIEYVNKKLGFSLTIPKSWEGNYTIKEEDGLVRFLFTYEGKKNDATPPLFSISYEPKKEDGWNEDLRWMGELTAKNDMGYYYYYDALHLYTEGTLPGEEQDTVSTMANQIFDVFNSFKMLETEEAVATEKETRGDIAGEARPKDEPIGNTAEEAFQKQANGIEYVNKKLGFSLTIPEFWKDHYTVEEDERGGLIFKFKFNGKVYKDIYLFKILIENREYSSEEQEMMGDIGILEVKNGKTYLISENIALYYYDNYDDYFASVPKDGRKMIETMSKQKKILNFKVLEGDVAEKAKEGERKGSPAEEAKSHNIHSANGYVLTNENNSIVMNYVNKNLKYKIFANQGFVDISSVSAQASVAQAYAAKANSPLNNLSEDLNKTTVNREKVMYALRNYSDPEQAVNAGLVPGTVLISPESATTGFMTIHRYGHAAIVATDGEHVIEAAGPGTIVKKTPISEFTKNHPYWVAFFVDGATNEQAKSAALYAEKQEEDKKPYITNGFLEEVGDLFFRGGFLTGKYREDAFYCSSLIWRAWKNQGLDIDVNDDLPTPIKELGTVIKDLYSAHTLGNFGFKLHPNEIITVFPAEIVRDPLMIPTAVSKELEGQNLEPKDAAFTNKLTIFSLAPSEQPHLKPYNMDIWQSKGHIFKLNVTENKSESEAKISIDDYYSYTLKPGETLKDIYVTTPVGYHNFDIRCVARNRCEIKGTLQSVMKKN